MSRDALLAELDRVAAWVQAAMDDASPPDCAREEVPALEALVAAFGLTPFERDVLLLCAGTELESHIAGLCGGEPTFSLALAALPDPHWSALTPAAPLRRWRMIEPVAGGPLTTAPLRIDERVLHHLAGVDHLDAELEPLLEPIAPGGAITPSQTAAVSALAAAPGLVVLLGADAESRRAAAAAAYGAAFVLPAAELPASAVERDVLARRWEREAALGTGTLVVELSEGTDPAVSDRVAAFADTLRAPLVLSAGEPLARPPARRAALVDLPRPRGAEQRELWTALLPDAAAMNGALDRLTGQFDLTAPTIAAAAAQAGEDPDALWDACRAHVRPRFGGLAERLDPAATWDDLVLPDAERAALADIAAHVRGRTRVHDDWGFAGKSRRGLGVSVLFEGPSGSGKTMAAEVLARALALDLYRIDLSQVVSKYIGETERNLRAVFDAAESGAAILLFDEADALFGTRTEVKDSHDRYANIEVSYLLQRMESYRGLAILTTNAKDAIDTAFLRRLRFVVRFPFPGEAERADIWRRVFPDLTPTERLDPEQLARLSLAGGNIRNVALGAAFLAADAGEPVRMAHVASAARTECRKLGRPLSETELAAWG